MASPQYIVRLRAAEALRKDIKKALIDHGLDQKGLAMRMGRTEQTVSYWVNHPETLNLERWQALNDVLHLDPANFIKAAGFNLRKD